MSQTAQHVSNLLCENAKSTLNGVLFDQYGIKCTEKVLDEGEYIENILKVDLAKANFKCNKDAR